MDRTTVFCRRTSKVVAASILFGVGPLVAGCVSSSKVENRQRSVTVGQELQDLEDARNKGLLTEDEYYKKRDEIMKRKD